jgi:capsular exopolysaccharide synthesis family protein
MTPSPELTDQPSTQLVPVNTSRPPAVLAARALRPVAPTNEEDDRPSAPGTGVAAFLRALRRRWGLALALVLGSLALATGAAWKLVPEKHTAQTLLRVESTPPALLFSSPENPGNALNYQRAQLALVKSRLVLNAALRQQHVAELPSVRDRLDPVEWLEKNIKADYSLAPEILRISMNGADPAELKVLVNAVREAYLHEIVDKEKEDRNIRLERLKRLHADYDERLRTSRANLRKLAEGVGTQDSQTLAHRQQFAQERLAQTQRELAQIQSELRKTRLDAAAHEARRKALEDTADAAAVEELIGKDPVLLKHRQGIADLELKIEAAKRVALRGEDEPSIKRDRARIESLNKAIAERRAKLRPTALEQVREKARNTAALHGADLRGRTALLEEMEKSLSQDAEKLEKAAHQIGRGAIDLESHKQDLAQAEDMAKKLGAQVEALNVEFQAPSRVSVIEHAVVNEGDGRKRKLLLTGGAGLGACLLCLLGLGLWEMRAGRIGTLDEVKTGLGLPVVGVLPQLPASSGQPVGEVRSPRQALLHQVWTESVDATRTLLLNMVRTDALRVLMITSANSGEGKTSLSGHLAASLARAGFRTLLVDGDLRSPVLHRLFGQERGPGLCEVLRVEAPLIQAVRPTPLEGLSFLPSGRWNGRALQALARERGRALFETLKEQYDFVLVDSAPVLPVADSLLLAQHVDAVLFSLLRDVSRAPAVFAAQERIALLGVRVLGAVVNGVHNDTYGIPYKYVPPADGEEA